MEFGYLKNFVKNNNTPINLRIKFAIITFLNITDAICTQFLIGTGYFEECNILMKGLVNKNLVVSVAFKAVFPAGLLFLVFAVLKHASGEEIAYVNGIVNAALVTYVAVNMLHVFYFGMLEGFRIAGII